VNRTVTERSGSAIAWLSRALRRMSAASPGAVSEEIDSIFQKWDRPDSPGFALAVIHDGRIVYERGYGMADLDHAVPITPSTVFHAASLAKQFTAMAIMLLVGRGEVLLDDDARRYLGELPDFGVGTITVRDLLQHTSGLRDQWVMLSLGGWRLSDDAVMQEDVAWLVSRMREVNFVPRTAFSYCNTGYTLAGEIVRRVAGTSLRGFLNDMIFTPLGMHASVIRERHGLVVRDHAYGYRHAPDGTFEVRMPNYDLVGPTNMLTNVRDLARWDANFDHATVGGRAGLAEMQTKGTLITGAPIDYGLGLYIRTYRGWKIVEHDGRDAGYRSHLMRFPELRLSLATLCNVAVESPELPGNLLRKVADLYLARLSGTAPAAHQLGAGPPRVAPTATPDRYGRLDDDRPPQLTIGADDADTIAVEPTPTAGMPMSGLSEFEGRYYSDELDTDYRIVQREGTLVIMRPKFAPAPLRAVAPDTFKVAELGLLKNADLVFVRDVGGRIDGFALTGDRVRNIRFVTAVGP
jgi:CubicO group peptidase (beta-lactamase class C family)